MRANPAELMFQHFPYILGTSRSYPPLGLMALYRVCVSKRSGFARSLCSSPTRATMPAHQNRIRKIQATRKGSTTVTLQSHVDNCSNTRKTRPMANSATMPPTQKLSLMPSPMSLVIRILSVSGKRIQRGVDDDRTNDVGQKFAPEQDVGRKFAPEQASDWFVHLVVWTICEVQWEFCFDEQGLKLMMMERREMIDDIVAYL
ncbi:uncharacterized protein LY79DRAFT_547459 [Colletotrichum navitas]|uniref:Uncharacterized protein n=1 Tax=Colletotrichum navitas TaxID=681940 RepID=A0AAD8Q4J1_9PEZI|nr:uncharacterized protein LY79DRAFT_547459 [Colletotrichum navitas]KAK1595348.1 hypothetical protein LY79DRAFT_547459 [Colletotrichum navitas]